MPADVSDDPLTREYRRNVKKRDISIAFFLDSNGNIKESPPGSVMAGLYSFVPVSEVTSGCKFMIQADFLVQPGRDALNNEASWNKWLVSEIGNLAIDALDTFKKHDIWKYQFYNVFQFDQVKGAESYEKLFVPFLINKVREKIENDKCIITRENEWEFPQNIRITDETDEAIEALSEYGLCEKGKEAEFLSGEAGAKLLNSNSLKWVNKGLFKVVNRFNLLRDEERLKKIANSDEKYRFFRSLYLWISECPFYETDYRYSGHKREKRYHDYEIVLGRTGGLQRGGNLRYIPEYTYKALDSEAIKSIETKYELIDPGIFETLDADSAKKLVNFLRGFTGLQEIDPKRAYIDLVLPRIQVNSESRLTDEELVDLTVSASHLLKEDTNRMPEIYVLCKDGKQRNASEVIFSAEYNIKPGWDINQKYLPGLQYLSPKYLNKIGNSIERDDLVKFLQRCGVEDSPKNGIEEFAVNFVKDWLEQNKLKFRIQRVESVEKRDFGYDLDVERVDGKNIKIEVKGMSSESDIHLSENETKSADKFKSVLHN